MTHNGESDQIIAGAKLARGAAMAQTGRMSAPPPFHKLAISDQSWARFRRLMLFMLYHELGAVSVHFYIAVGLGVTGAMGLMSVLMGLVFLSNESGHDAAVIDPESGDSV
jgi:hypothetical protein